MTTNDWNGWRMHHVEWICKLLIMIANNNNGWMPKDTGSLRRLHQWLRRRYYCLRMATLRHGDHWQRTMLWWSILMSLWIAHRLNPMRMINLCYLRALNEKIYPKIGIYEKTKIYMIQIVRKVNCGQIGRFNLVNGFGLLSVSVKVKWA